MRTINNSFKWNTELNSYGAKRKACPKEFLTEPVGSTNDNRGKKTESRMWVPFYREIAFVWCPQPESAIPANIAKLGVLWLQAEGGMKQSPEVLAPSWLSEREKAISECVALCALSFLSESSHVKVISENKLCQNTVSLIILSRPKAPLIQTLERQWLEDFTRSLRLESSGVLSGVLDRDAIVINIHGPRSLC